MTQKSLEKDWEANWPFIILRVVEVVVAPKTRNQQIRKHATEALKHKDTINYIY